MLETVILSVLIVALEREETHNILSVLTVALERERRHIIYFPSPALSINLTPISVSAVTVL